MTQKIGQGGTIPLDAEFTDGTGALVDPGTPLVDILDPDDVAVVSDAVPTRQSTGRYVFEHEVALDAALGMWTAHWTGSINGVPVVADDPFEVVAAGSVDFDGQLIADVLELRTYMGLPALSSTQEAAADAILRGLQNDLEAYLGRPATIREFTEAPRIDRHGNVSLRWTPVLEIASLTVDGSAVDSTMYLFRSWGLKNLFVADPSFGLTEPVVAVTYRAGLDGRNEGDPFGRSVKPKLLRAAAREFNQVVREDAAGVSRFSVEGTSISFVGEGGWLPSELESLRRWKKRTART